MEPTELLPMRLNTKRAKRLNSLVKNIVNVRRNHADYNVPNISFNWIHNDDNTRSLASNDLFAIRDKADSRTWGALSEFTGNNPNSSWEEIKTNIKNCVEAYENNAQKEHWLKYSKALHLAEYIEANTYHPPRDLNNLNTAIKRTRRYLRDQKALENKNFGKFIEAYKDSWDAMSPSRVLDKYLPKGTAVGVEIEWVAPAREYEEGNYDNSTMDIERPVKNTDNYIHGTQWKYDTSISTPEAHHYRQGQEACVMLRYGKWDRLIKVCDYIKDNGGEVNKSCGLHIHLDCRDISAARALTKCKRIKSALPWLLKMVPKSRRKNSYCRPDFAADEKYYAITAHKLHHTGSFEVRLHSGTLNPTKIINWIRLIHFISNRYVHMQSLEEFLNSDADADLKKYVIKRVAKFETNTTTDSDDCESEQIAEIEANQEQPEQQ